MCSGTDHNHLQRHHSKAKGYTLIEVLVAMAIFSSMMMLGGVALNQGLKQYHGLAEKGIGFWEYAKKIWIDKNLNSMIDYYIYTNTDGWIPYFKGNQDGISYVSLAPLTGELPVVVWIKNEAGTNGKHSLVYYELPVYTKSFEEIERESIFGDYKKGKSLKLLEEMEGIEFSFYGYNFPEKRFGWFNQFDGNRMKFLPSSIMISYRQNGKKDRFIFGINVNSYLKMVYNDIYLKQ